MDETPIDFHRLKAACEQLHARELEGVEDPIDQLAKKVEFAAELGAIALLFLAEQLREHMAETGTAVHGLRVGVAHTAKHQDRIVGPWQACVDGQWILVPDDPQATQALEGIDHLLTGRKALKKHKDAASMTGGQTAGLIEQTILSSAMLNIKDIGNRSWRTLDLAPAALNALARHIAGAEALALSQNLALEANTPAARGRKHGPRL